MDEKFTIIIDYFPDDGWYFPFAVLYEVRSKFTLAKQVLNLFFFFNNWIRFNFQIKKSN